MKHTLILLALMNVAAFAAERMPLPTAHTARNIEGWTVRVDDRQLHGDGAAVGERSLKLLTSRLVAITIQLDLNYGDLVPMQYHRDNRLAEGARLQRAAREVRSHSRGGGFPLPV